MHASAGVGCAVDEAFYVSVCVCQVCQQRGPFEGKLVTTWLAQLCAAVAHMHERRVLHRDIASGNIFLT